MKFAVEVIPFGPFGEARVVMQLAQAAEAAGWDGLFVWDHLGYVFGMDGGDAWVLLSAAAVVTARIRLGTSVTPLPRRRPHVLAQTLATIDRLSSGRLIFGAGAGGTEPEFAVFGEDPDARRRAAMLDEGLLLLDGLLRGEKMDFAGSFYTARGVTLQPLPVQQPRPPIWIGGESMPALRRAARWDGWAAGGVDRQGKQAHPSEWYAERIAYIQEHRSRSGVPASQISPETGGTAFDISVTGCTIAGENDLPRSYAQAGVTWWQEAVYGYRGSVREMLQRVEAGPPK